MPFTRKFITGQAGTGKTTYVKNKIAEAKVEGGKYRSYGTLAATTGIAALNLSGGTGDTVSTVNSLLGFFDLESLQDAYAERRLHTNLKSVARLGLNLIVDEISMFQKEALQLIDNAVEDINGLGEIQDRGGLGIILVGDFCQLSPIKGDFCFHARCFENYKIEKLTKVWRQENPQFLEMINAARAGDGIKTAQGLMEIEGIQVRNRIDSQFDGTTIVAVNKVVDSMNEVRLEGLLNDPKTNNPFTFKSFRWGKQRSEWKQVPEERLVCKNAYVMILANDAPDFTYANGSCGYIVDANIDSGTVTIRLKDNGNYVTVRRVTRKFTIKETPIGYTEPEKALTKAEYREKFDWDKDIIGAAYKSYLGKLTAEQRKNPCAPYYDFNEKKWVIGEISYTPVRLAYATTVHKSQGLTLDSCQIDFGEHFFGFPSMAYVALSRTRNPQGLTVVGNRKIFEDRTNISEEVVQWI